MGIKIPLKKRYQGTNFQLPVRQVVETLKLPEDEAKQLIYESFQKMVEGKGAEIGYVHDRTSLAVIANWLPEGGYPLNLMGDWIPLMRKINNLDDDAIELNVSTMQANMLWDRINSDEFVIHKVDPSFIDFVGDLAELLGKKFKPA